MGRAAFLTLAHVLRRDSTFHVPLRANESSVGGAAEEPYLLIKQMQRGAVGYLIFGLALKL